MLLALQYTWLVSCAASTPHLGCTNCAIDIRLEFKEYQWCVNEYELNHNKWWTQVFCELGSCVFTKDCSKGLPLPPGPISHVEEPSTGTVLCIWWGRDEGTEVMVLSKLLWTPFDWVCRPPVPITNHNQDLSSVLCQRVPLPDSYDAWYGARHTSESHTLRFCFRINVLQN